VAGSCEYSDEPSGSGTTELVTVPLQSNCTLTESKGSASLLSNLTTGYDHQRVSGLNVQA
jgi:hypothetical protein